MKKRDIKHITFIISIIVLSVNLLWFMLISLPSIIIEYYSYDYYIFLALVAIVNSIIMSCVLIKYKERIMGLIFICLGLIFAAGCLIVNNGIHSFKVKVISVGENSVVVEKDKEFYEIKKPSLVKIKESNYIYAKYENEKNIMHYVISPNFGKVIVIIGDLTIVFCTLYIGYRLLHYGFVIKKRGKKNGKKK